MVRVLWYVEIEQQSSPERLHRHWYSTTLQCNGYPGLFPGVKRLACKAGHQSHLVTRLWMNAARSPLLICINDDQGDKFTFRFTCIKSLRLHKGRFTHSMSCPCRSPPMPFVNSHIPCRAPALLRQCRFLRESLHGSRKYPNC